jgi:hypothetical protein
MKRLILALIGAALTLTACKAPPPAPEGLDASAAYMVREFYQDDLTFQSGLVGFVNWFEDEGYELLDLEATTDNVSESFQVAPLTDSDIGYLPLEHGRVISDAAGVVSLAQMACPVSESEEYLVRTDQAIVFPDDWESYGRTFINSRTEFQDATISGEFAPIDEAIDAFVDGFDPEALSSTLLQTQNRPDPHPLFLDSGDVGEYDLYLDFRHGVFDINGEELTVLAIITYNTESVSDAGGNNFLHQSYSIDINVQWEETDTLRMFAVWAEPEGAGLEPDSPIVLRYAVNKSVKSSERLTRVCNGEDDLPAEP